MTEASRIRKNSIYSFISIVSRLIANVVVFWIIARSYGPELFGQFTFAQTLSAIFILFADFGFDVLLTNEIAKDRNKAINLFQQYFSLKIIFTLFALISMWLFVFLNDLGTQSQILILVFSFYMVFTALTNFLYALYKGLEQLEFETIVSLIVNVGLLIVTVILIILHSNLIWIALAFVGTRFFGFILGLKYAVKILRNLSFKLIYKGFSEIKEKVIVFGFHLTLSYLFFQLDTILLALWKGDYEVGIYQSVFKLILVPLVIPDILINSLMPVLARLNAENHTNWEKIGGLMSRLLLIIVLPISITLFFYSNQIITFIYGGEMFIEAVPILKIFAIILFVRFNLETFALLLTTSDRQKVRLCTVLIATALNFIINYFMIPLYGVIGAALVSLVTNIFVGAVYIISNRYLFLKWMINLKMLLTILFSLTIGYVAWLFNYYSIFLVVPILFGSFFLFTYFYFFSVEEIKLIFSGEIGLFKKKFYR